MCASTSIDGLAEMSSSSPFRSLDDRENKGSKMHIKSVSIFFICMFFFSATCNAQKAKSPAAQPADAPHRQYIKTVQEYVNEHWSYRKTLDNQFYSVQLDLILNREGAVLEKKVLKLSSDEEYNKYALKALGDMEPYPSIPDDLDDDTIRVRFHLMPNK